MSVVTQTVSGNSSEGPRFGFGENWAAFLPSIDRERIDAAVASLSSMLGTTSLAGRRFVDVGSGSGLFSLAARMLGASVHSFDFDPASVRCTEILRSTYFPNDEEWTVEQGSVLDESYLRSLGKFDVVYSWGVLHHTGSMWDAVANALTLVIPRGTVFIALYNDQGWISRYWTAVKRSYNRGAIRRSTLIGLHWPYLVGLRATVRFLSRRPRSERGMNLWHDMKDWLGGWPFEVATPTEVQTYFMGRGFRLTKSSLCGRRHGCNEFVFVSTSGNE